MLGTLCLLHVCAGLGQRLQLLDLIRHGILKFCELRGDAVGLVVQIADLGAGCSVRELLQDSLHATAEFSLQSVKLLGGDGSSQEERHVLNLWDCIFHYLQDLRNFLLDLALRTPASICSSTPIDVSRGASEAFNLATSSSKWQRAHLIFDHMPSSLPPLCA